MTKEPYYKPGYTGYLEGDKFMIGGTIAQRSATSIGMRSTETPDMRHSRHQNHRPVTSLNTRGAIMPGYTGFYPKHQDTNQGIGERYSVRATRGFVAQDSFVKRRKNKMENIRAQEIRQLQSKLENDKANERVDSGIAYLSQKSLRSWQHNAWSTGFCTFFQSLDWSTSNAEAAWD